ARGGGHGDRDARTAGGPVHGVTSRLSPSNASADPQYTTTNTQPRAPVFEQYGWGVNATICRLGRGWVATMWSGCRVPPRCGDGRPLPPTLTGLLGHNGAPCLDLGVWFTPSRPMAQNLRWAIAPAHIRGGRSTPHEDMQQTPDMGSRTTRRRARAHRALIQAPTLLMFCALALTSVGCAGDAGIAAPDEGADMVDGSDVVTIDASFDQADTSEVSPD